MIDPLTQIDAIMDATRRIEREQTSLIAMIDRLHRELQHAKDTREYKTPYDAQGTPDSPTQADQAPGE